MQKTPKEIFSSDHYVRHNMRRLEHLASLGLPLYRRTVLELGAGIGDHTLFYLDRGCSVTALEGREENVEAARARLAGEMTRYPDQYANYLAFDLDDPAKAEQSARIEPAEIVHCYGILYHLRNPLSMLRWSREKCLDILIVETALSAGAEERIAPEKENIAMASQALSGLGSRPTRQWVFNTLKRLFPFVYVPCSQPSHEEFPLDWRPSQLTGKPLIRGVFVASLRPLGSPALLDRPPERQSSV